jgi:ribosome-associated protein
MDRSIRTGPAPSDRSRDVETRFTLTTDYIKLSALLKATDIADSGGHAKTLIQDGQVQVNGGTETRRGRKIRTGDVVEVMSPRARILVES